MVVNTKMIGIEYRLIKGNTKEDWMDLRKADG